MTPINGVGNNNPVHRVVNQSISRPASAEPTGQPRAADRLELSGMAPFVRALKAASDVRTDKVAAIKAQIEAGTYETDEKLDIAVDRLIEDLGL